MPNKCVMGAENRQMIIDLKETMKTGFNGVGNELKEIKVKNETMFNHLSSRLPIWATILFTILGSALVGLLVKLVS